jgi:glycosyltransferase involved in cell wall biosynthesis
MASGTLVATSNVSSMPEVGGDIAFYFDPYDGESIANALMRVVNLSPSERCDRVERGIARARTFTWERCKQQTVGVLERLL